MVSTSNYLSLLVERTFPRLNFSKHDMHTHCLPKTSEYNFVQRECFHLNSASHFKCKNASFLGLPVRMLISWSKSWGFHIPPLPEMRELVARRAARGSWSCAEWIRGKQSALSPPGRGAQVLQEAGRPAERVEAASRPLQGCGLEEGKLAGFCVCSLCLCVT